MIDKELVGYYSLAAALTSYILYFISIANGRTKPHAFSWTTWGILTLIAFYAQYSNGAGPGAWATGCVALLCFAVAATAVFIGEKDIKFIDLVMFICALSIIPVWYFTKEPLPAIIMIVFIDALGGYYPTFRKSYHKPHEELLLLYLISMLQVILSLFAMEHYYLVNIIYPIFILFSNAAFIIMVMWLRIKKNVA